MKVVGGGSIGSFLFRRLMCVMMWRLWLMLVLMMFFSGKFILCCEEIIVSLLMFIFFMLVSVMWVIVRYRFNFLRWLSVLINRMFGVFVIFLIWMVMYFLGVFMFFWGVRVLCISCCCLKSGIWSGCVCGCILFYWVYRVRIGLRWYGFLGRMVLVL